MFSLHIYKSSLSVPKAVNARKAAQNTIEFDLNEQDEMIKRDFEIKNWIVIL